MILRFIRRQRALRDLENAKVRVATLSRLIDHNRKAHKAFRPLMGSLYEARKDMLRAEIRLRGMM